MRRFKAFIAGTLVLLLGAAPLPAQNAGSVSFTVASYYDHDGAAADADLVVTAADVVDSTAYTIAAQPDVPRPLVVVTAVGANSCIADLVGTLADGRSVSSTVTWTTTTTTSPSPNYNFASVTSFTTRVCTGEAAGETLTLGTSATIPTTFVAPRGRAVTATSAVGTSGFSRFEWRNEQRKVNTTGSSTSLTSDTASSGAFTFVAVGSLLRFNVNGRIFERVVLTWTDADNVVVDEAIDLSDGYSYNYKTFYKGPDDEDGWIPVRNFTKVSFVFNVLQNDPLNADDLNTVVQCEIIGAASAPVTVDTDALLSLGNVVSTVDLGVTPYDRCRAGFSWETSDDAVDTTTAQEQIGVFFAGTLR